MHLHACKSSAPREHLCENGAKPSFQAVIRFFKAVGVGQGLCAANQFQAPYTKIDGFASKYGNPRNGGGGVIPFGFPLYNHAKSVPSKKAHPTDWANANIQFLDSGPTSHLELG